MKITVLSDIHDHLDNLRKVIDSFAIYDTTKNSAEIIEIK